ncbi:hypothetical protein JCM21900_005822 [Sporobolomyces salmonicolor]
MLAPRRPGSTPLQVSSTKSRFSIPLALLLLVQPLLIWSFWHPTSLFPQSLYSAAFPLSPDPKPVHHLPELIDYTNTPIAPSRPSVHQFVLDPKADLSRPAVAIITATKDAKPEYFRDTAASVFGQSLQNFLWVIIDDATTQAGSLEVLEELQKDPRVVVLRNKEPKGLGKSRNRGLKFVLKRRAYVPPYLAVLDDDDMYELTALEKVSFMLESNAEWDLGGFHVVKFGHKNELVLSGLHNGAANFLEGNFVPDAAVMTTRALIASKCRFEEDEFIKGGENWVMWMCLAKAGHWGGTIREPLYWQRMKADKEKRTGLMGEGSQALNLYIQQKHAALEASGAFPEIAPRPAQQLEQVRWDFNISNGLAPNKALMFVLPNLGDNFAARTALRQLELAAKRGYRVTVVSTGFEPIAGLDLRPEMLQWSHDVHVIPSYIRPSDAPGYIKNLIISRGIREVIFSQTQLMYELLPILTEKLPNVHFIDVLHRDAEGRFASFSSISQRFLSRTITTSHSLRAQLLAAGTPASRVGVSPLGIDTQQWVPVAAKTRAFAKRELLALRSDKTTVILSVGHLDAVTRPLLIPEIANALRGLGHRSFLFVVFGHEGDELVKEMQRRTKALRVDHFVRVYTQSVEHVESYIAASDIYLRTSESNELSSTIEEAMSMGLPIVSSATTGVAEQLGQGRSDDLLGGVAIPTVFDDKGTDVVGTAEKFAVELDKMILHRAVRHRYGAAARRIAEDTHDYRLTVGSLFTELRLAHLPNPFRSSSSYSSSSSSSPIPINPAAHYALQTVLRENHDETDFASSQQRLRAPPRVGYGKELQNRCGETSADITKWIDALEEPRSCDPAVKLNVSVLRRSAKFQCTAWCIFDLTEPELAGWTYNGYCFEKMDEKSWCKAFWSGRPQMNLPKIAAGED